MPLPNYEASFPDPTNDAAVQMDVVHANIHKGWMWHANMLQLALAADADFEALISVGTIPAHMRFLVAATQTVQVMLFEGADATGGSSVTAQNRNRFLAEANPLTTITTGPTVVSPGTSLGPALVPGGGSPHAPGGSVEGFEEWLLLPATKYMFRLSNDIAGGTTDVHISLDWYEPPPKTPGQL